MAFFLRDNEDEVLEGNIYYWKISKLLEGMSSLKSTRVNLTFKLHSKTWGNLFAVDEESVYVDTTSKSKKRQHIHPFFDMRTGIVGDDLKEIVAVKCCAFDKLISRSEFDSLLLSKKILYLFTEIRRKGENVQQMKASKEQIETDYRDLLISGKNSDVTLEVKNKKFHCHRCILAARSPVFAAMMKNDVEKRAIGDVIIEDADPDVFQKFLLFLYTGKDHYISWQNVTDLYKLAEKYSVEDIKDVCRNDIKENYRSSNFRELLKLSQLHKDSELKKICRNKLKEDIRPSEFSEYFNLALLHNDSELMETTVQFFLKRSKEIVRHKNWTTFLSEDSKKWLSVDHIKKIITTENFFFFFKLSQIQRDSELTETTVQFFLNHSKEIVRSENWMALQVENAVECNVLIRALTDK